MKKYWISFLIIIGAGIILTAVYSSQQTPPSDKPERNPTRDEIVPPGVWSNDVSRVNDESQASSLMRPSPLIRSSTDRIQVIACSHGTDLCKIQANYDYVRVNYRMLEASTADHIRSPSELLLYGEGTRLELALLLASMQISAGFHTEVLRGPQTAFVRVRYNNETVVMDPSCAGCAVMNARVMLKGDELVFSQP